MYWRLGLDLGTSSIGWAAFEQIDEEAQLTSWRLVGSGVRVFRDSREPAKGGRVGDSLAVERRLARGMRRNRDRSINRRNYMMQRLIEFGLMPSVGEERRKLENLNPYELRSRAVEGPISAHELGRVLFHLGKRRGFKSNRKEKRAADSDVGLREGQITALRQAMGNKTLGQFLWDRLQQDQSIRFRGDTDWFADRAMYAKEFDLIRDRQRSHHALTVEQWEQLRDNCILFQHPLKPVERGRCTLLPDYRRAHRDTPIAQWFRIYQELANLRWVDLSQNSHVLTLEQRQAILAKLLAQKSLTFGAIRKLKGADGTRLFDRESRFNLEDERRKGLEGHKIAVWMKATPDLTTLWESEEQETLDDIFEALHDAESDELLIPSLIRRFRVTEQQAHALADLPLGSTTQNISRKAMETLVPIMRDQGLEYYDAVKQMTGPDGEPLHHSDLGRTEHRSRLPYYGEVLSTSVMGGDPAKDANKDPEGHYGRIANSTVHVALNQVRKVVNALIDRFGGEPNEIHVELSRDLKLSPAQRSEINREIAKNTRRNEKLRDLWADISGGQQANARDLRKLKLWQELGEDELARRCVFSGRVIAAHHLLNGEVEIEHLLPFSRTLDDTMANLTLAFKDANLIKGNNGPFEAFSEAGHPSYIWDDIKERASRLPKNKRWRFAENAMERWEGENDFIARQLTDNAFISRAARKYLTVLTGHVVPAPGRLTAMIRGKWHLGLGEDGRKTRDDHRHHAIDAFVVGLADRGLLQRISHLTGRDATGETHLEIPELPDSLRQGLDSELQRMVISYKPDHGHQGRMFNETAYGVLRYPVDDYNLVVRKPIESLSAKELSAIRDPVWKARIEEYLYAKGWFALDKVVKIKTLPDFLVKFGQENNVRSIRVLVKNQTAKAIQSAPHKAYAPDSYVCCDIWAMPKGKPGRWKKGEEVWRADYLSFADCASGIPNKTMRQPHPAARYVCRLFKEDMVAFDENGQRQVMRVAGFSTTDNKLDVRPHNLADAPRRFISVAVLAQKNMRQIFVKPDGTLFDPKRGHN